jgi:hypothetical protein
MRAGVTISRLFYVRQVDDLAEILTQDEIDTLMSSLNSGEAGDDAAGRADRGALDDAIRAKHKTVVAAMKRYDFALECCSFDEVKDARFYFHIAAFDLWLANRNMTRRDYRQLIRREISRRKKGKNN